jgi:hypothetical protein
MPTTDLPVVKSRTGKTHAVYASGHAEDGSLFGFYTLCGLYIGIVDQWPEQPERTISCGNCQRIDAIRMRQTNA